MKRLTVTPKVALIFHYCCLSQFRPTCIKKPFSKKRKSILSFLPGEFFLDCRIATKADFCLKLARILSGRSQWHRAGRAQFNATLEISKSVAIDPAASTSLSDA